MQCIHPIEIVNTTKFVSPFHKQRLLQRVACGKCAACQQRLQNEWYYRAMYEYMDCVKQNGYMLFDCLTYAEDTIPRIGDYFDCPRWMKKIYCFDYQHVTKWKKAVESQLERDGYGRKNLKYFISSEYGTAEDKTHRIHYHVLVYCYNPDIKPEYLNCLMADKWKYGRTDGISWKGLLYFYENVLLRSGVAASVRVCKYVSKYVAKSCMYQKEIEKRVNCLMWHIFESQFVDYTRSSYNIECPFNEYYDWKKHPKRITKFRSRYDDVRWLEFCDSPRGKRIRAAIERRINQFHRQSHEFGLSAIDYMDYEQLVRSGTCSVLDNNKPVMIISLPTYYKRKLFYDKINVKGVQMWSPNVKGRKYLKDREKARFDLLKEQYQVALSAMKIDCDVDALVRYEMFEFGRMKNGKLYDFFPDDVVKTPNIIYNYSSLSDVQHFKIKGVTSRFLGASQIGYKDDEDLPKFQPINEFINENIARNAFYDSVLEKISDFNLSNKGQPVQRYYEHKQKLTDIYKSLFARARF